MKEYKFFERHLDNNLGNLSRYLQGQYKRIENGELVKGNLEHKGIFGACSSVTTNNFFQYNVFQFFHPAIHDVFKSVKEMTIEACEYYGFDFKKERFMVQGWFNINHSNEGKLDWHDHAQVNAPFFHGYYCVNAEPSVTEYQVNGKIIKNHNKNNRAILAEMGHPHAMADWDWEGPRITIAYDVVPLKFFTDQDEQHWLPLI